VGRACVERCGRVDGPGRPRCATGFIASTRKIDWVEGEDALEAVRERRRGPIWPSVTPRCGK
jgi:hypothetical protein